MKPKLWTAVIVAGATLTALRVPGFGVVAYAFLALAPGWLLYRVLQPERDVLGSIVAATVLSPAIVTGLGVLMIAAGVPVNTIIVTVAGIAGIMAFAARNRTATEGPAMSRGATIGILATITVICFVTLQLPFASEWWRIRSDGWFHVAVVAQIADFGVPPDDPYFLGLPLQYMWAYHVFVLILTQASGIDPSIVMALINLQALIAFALIPVLLSSTLGRRPLHGFCSMLMVLFSMNALFWLFLPIKFARALTGEVRGLEEIRRIITLPGFDMDTVKQLTIVFYNHYFFMDKFMVSTPLAMGIALMAATWLGAVRYAGDPRPYHLAMAFLGLAGTLLMHPLFGVVTAASLLGGLTWITLARKGLNNFSMSANIRLAVALVGAGLITLPYLISITHAKEGDNIFPLILSFRKIAGLLITCALALVLTAFQARQLRATNSVSMRFFVLSALTVLAIGLVIAFPGSNLYSKPPFFVLFPLAIIGGWTFVDLASRRRRPALVLATLLITALAPINVVQYAAYYNTPRPRVLSPAEREVARWVGENTPREAVFFDSADRVFLLVSGPRRYYWGRQSYADLWGYDSQEMASRRRVRDQLYSTVPLGSDTLARLAALDTETYVIARDDDGSDGRFARDTSVFVPAFVTPRIVVYRIDRDACRTMAGAM